MVSGRPHYFKFSLGQNLGMGRGKSGHGSRGALTQGRGRGRREESRGAPAPAPAPGAAAKQSLVPVAAKGPTLKARGQLNRERPARQKGGTRWKLTGRVWPSSPLELQAPLFVPVLPSSAPPAQPPAVPSEPAPAGPPPSQHAAAQPVGIVQFCTVLHRLVGVAVDKPQGKRWAC